MQENCYAVYKDDKFLFLGTAKECGDHLGIKPKSVKFKTTPTYKKRCHEIYENRTIIIKVEAGD